MPLHCHSVCHLSDKQHFANSTRESNETRKQTIKIELKKKKKKREKNSKNSVYLLKNYADVDDLVENEFQVIENANKYTTSM